MGAYSRNRMSKALTVPSDNEPSKWDDKFDKIVKWFNDDRPDDDPQKTKLPASLLEQLQRWNWLHDMLSIPKHRYKSDAAVIKILQKQYPDLSERTCRFILRDTKRFFGIVSQPELAYEKVLLLQSIKETLDKARLKNDLKAKNAAEKNLIAVLGADKTEEKVENKTIINIINFNPEQLGAIPMSQEKLDEMIEKMLSADTKKAEQPFDDFEDVSDQK